MKTASRRMVPIIVCLVALACIWYALTLEQRRMIGDDTAHDPGSRAMPLAAGTLMLAAGLYETFRRPSRKQPAGERGSVRLFFITLGSSVAYIFLLEPVGFIPLTTVFLFTLVTIYKGTARPDGRIPARSFLIGLPLSAGISVLLYTAGRLVSRELFYWGRAEGIGLLSSRTFTILSFTFIAGILYALFAKIAYSRTSAETEGRVLSNSVMLSAATTLLLYLVFRMIFRVSFPAGLIFW